MVRVQEAPPSYRACPPLENGDHLDAAEFMRRYEGMEARGQHVSAELINGIVYLMYPAHIESHGKSDAILQLWLGHYAAYAPHVDHAINGTLILGEKSMPMPDGVLWDTEAKKAWLTKDDYLEGAPEFITETAASIAAYDCNERLEVYRLAGVREYVISRTLESAVDWHVLENGIYVKIAADEQGVIRSRHLPGLWLSVPALVAKNRREVLRVLDEGLAANGFR